VVELHGGPDTSYDEVAEVLSEVLDRPVEHVTVSDDQFIGALTGMGVSRALAEALAELSAAIASGAVRHREPRSAENTTPTDYRTFAVEVFKPAFEAARRG
jgi:xanthine dehydrogenase molybdopterin-binding subunit B